MKKISITLTTLITLTAFVFPVFAHDEEGMPGTAEYLRNVLGWSEERLTTGVATEGREAFDTAVGEVVVDDPLGDVLGRDGTEAGMTDPWGDIASATLVKNTKTKTWDFKVVLGEDIPKTLTGKAALYVYADTDGKAENNSTDAGVKAEADAEFGVIYNAKTGWYTGFRWYNPDPKALVWATNKTTASTFRVSRDMISLSVPFAEMSADVTPRWRVVMALARGDETEIDVAPTVGFPEAKPVVAPTPEPEPAFSDRLRTWVAQPFNAGLLVAMTLAAAYLIWNAKKK